MEVLLQSRQERIQALNDALRRTLIGGKVMMTRAVAELPEYTRAKVLHAMMTFDAFTPDNDPYHEHDCFFFDVDGERYFTKIDYYDKSMEFGSDDPANENVTTRVLTLGTAMDF